jgi:hypothetical protein
MPAPAAPPKEEALPEAEVAFRPRTSLAAWLSLGFGIAAVLVLVSPLLALLAIAGAVSGLIALRALRRSEGQLSGEGLALCGLALSLFFLGLGLTQHLTRQSLVEQRARQLVDVWVRLLQEGQTQQAHQFRRPPPQRIRSAEALQEHYATNKEASQELQSFVSAPGIKELIQHGAAADTRFEEVVSAVREGASDLLLLKYSYVADRARPDDRRPLWIYVHRRYDEGSKRFQWEIGAVQTTPPPGVEP